MKEIIGGVVYDTDRARLICSEGPHWVSPGVDGTVRIKRTLYRGERGHFFELVEYPGEPNLFFRLLTGDWPGRARIAPVSQKTASAMAWRCGVDLKSLGLQEPERA